MNAIVLAAGKGERLGERTKDVPKPMLRIGDKIILEHTIRWLTGCGITNIFINLHHKPDIVSSHFGDGKNFDARIQYSHEKDLLGTAGAVKKILTDFKDAFSDSFLVIYGDNFYPSHYDLKSFLDAHHKDQNAVTIGLYSNKEELHKAGVVFLDKQNNITGFIEKPSHVTEEMQNKGWINAGVYLLPKVIAEEFPDGKSDFGKDIFPSLLDRKVSMKGYCFPKGLLAVDTEELLELNQGKRSA